MSEQKGSATKTIYVQLLGEGTIVYRPTQGVLLDENVYQVLATPDYNKSDEDWEFLPGSVVYCDFDDQKRLIARKKLILDGPHLINLTFSHPLGQHRLRGVY